jgi:hypothetical protein
MKTRSILFIIVTLIIGFILGMLTSAEVRSHRLNPMRVYFSEERFREGFYKAIQPNEQQKAQIDVILDKYAKINSELQTSFRKDLEENMKDFRKELDQNLTKDQLARLKDLDDRRQEMVRHNRKNHDNDSTNYRENRRHYEMGRPGQGGRHSSDDSTRLRNIK